MKISDLPAIGVITGKFMPLHNGHIYAIHKAATQCQKLIVLLSYDDKAINVLPNHLKSKLGLKNRLLWLKTTFEEFEHIEIRYIDESNIEPYPNGINNWVNLVKYAIPEDIDVWFSSEPEYGSWVTKYFTENHVIIDHNRKFNHISATEIRKDVLKNWENLPSVVRKDFVLKVCVIGTESCGKTTLTKMLSKIYSTSWVEEYGRTYCENDMCGDESLLTMSDYGLIASRRYELEKQAEKTANRLMICDTNAFITQFYCVLYNGECDPLVDEYINIEKYDLVLHLESDVEWVDDGLRINNNRKKTDELMEYMLDHYDIGQYGEQYHKISGSYSERLDKATTLINNLLGEYYEQ